MPTIKIEPGLPSGVFMLDGQAFEWRAGKAVPLPPAESERLWRWFVRPQIRKIWGGLRFDTMAIDESTEG